MELWCEHGDCVRVVINSQSHYFNWIVPIRQSVDAEAAEPFTGSLLPAADFWGWGKRQKPTLVLDLDLTMAYCKCLSNAATGGGYRMWGVAQRPGLEEFLKALAPLYELVMFTAADQSYADAVLQLIDPKAEFVEHRLYGRHLSRPELFKDLSRLGRDLRRVVVVDDVPAVYGEHAGNVIQIAPFIGDGSADDKLAKLVGLLTNISQAKDVRIDIAWLKQEGALDQIGKPW